MAEFCHPEFGCDCSNDVSFTRDEWAALLRALEQFDDEYGVLVGWKTEPDEPVNVLRAKHTAAADRGQALIEKVQAAARAAS